MDDPRNNVGVVCPRCGVGRIEGKDETVCHRCLLMEVFGGAFDSLELGATSSRLLPDHARAIRSALRPPPVIPDHELLQRIGAGSYGEVWLARNVVGTLRAVKVVWREDLESDKPYEREFDGIRRYEPVSRQHEGLVHILHVGRDDARGCFFYIMELADNAAEPPVEPSDGPSGNLPPAAPSNGARYRPETLREVLRRRHRLPVDECIELGVTLARALEGLHEAGLVHRDIKPSNIIFVGGRAKLADIGLVTGIAEARSFVGTEGYVPHEGPGTPEADLFSLGKVLYEASTGFDRNDFPRLPRAIAATTDETTAWALPELNEIILRCCEREPKRRYRSAREVRNDLSLLQAGRSVRRLRRLERNIKLATRAGVAAGLLALLAAGAYFGSFRQIERARRAEQQARDSANRLLWRQAETRFESDLSSDGLACLAHLVRNRPQDRAAVERLLSALSWRGFTLPVAEPARPRSRVQTMVQGPGGDELWTGSYSGAVECWRLSNGTALRPPWELGGRILGLEFAPDGQRVGITAAVRAGIFGIATGDPLFPVITRPRPFRFDGLRFDPPGDRFATFSVVGWAQIWDSRTGQPIGAEMRHEEKISELRFSPDGSRVATASQDGTARLWASADGRPLTPPLRHGGRVNDVEFSPDGHYLLTASDDQSAHLWEVESGRLKGVLPHGGVVRTAAFSPDGQTIVTASEDNSAILWNAATLNPLGRPLRHRGWVTKAVFSPDGQRVLTASDDNTVRIWDAATGQPLTEPLRHGHEIDVAQFSRDGRLVVSAARDALIWIRPATPQRAQPVMLWPEGHVSAACYSPDGTRLALGGGDGSIRLVDPSAPKEPTLFQVLTQPVKALHFSADGRRLLAATERAVRVWQFPDGRPLSEEWAHPAPVVSAQFDADGRSVVTACEDFVVRIWKVGPGVQPAHTLPHTERLLRAEFDRSGRRVLTSCWDGNTHLWDAQGGRWLLAWPHEHRVTHAEFSPDGCRVVTASIDRTAAIWNVDSGAPSPRSVRHDGDVLSARFSPDGRWIITASRDGTARVWDSESGEPVSEAMHHDTAVTHVRFSPDGLRVLTGTANGSVRLWDAATGLPVSDPFPQAGELVDLAFSPCGRSFITVSHTGEAQLYMVFQAHGPAPAWLAPLAEAVGGKRFNSRGMLDDVPPQAIFDLQRQLEQTRSSDPYSAWARWFLDRTALRQIAPGLALRQPDWVAHQMAAGSLAGLRAALALEPTNSLIYAQLARRLAEHENDLRAQKQAAWCLRRARELGGSDASRWAEGGSAPAPSSEAGGRKRPPAATLSTHPLLD